MESSQTQQEAPKTTDELLQAILAEQQTYRDQIANLKQEISSSRPTPTAAPAQNLSPEEAAEARLEEINQHSHYCPGCGLLYDYPQRCTGRAESGHAPIEVVSTDELKSGDTSKHTAPEYVKS